MYSRGKILEFNSFEAYYSFLELFLFLRRRVRFLGWMVFYFEEYIVLGGKLEVLVGDVKFFKLFFIKENENLGGIEILVEIGG